MLVLVLWLGGIKHQQDYVKIIEGLGSNEKTKIGKHLAFAATDSNQDDDFAIAFNDFNSEGLEIMRTEIKRVKSFHR
ncbi:MAG TPA: hypothetical protein VK612_02275 [Pyrinomonadaceae bacterium]|nr:hypothetical protein [Pyrinomonadaceae bacterium]